MTPARRPDKRLRGKRPGARRPPADQPGDRHVGSIPADGSQPLTTGASRWAEWPWYGAFGLLVFLAGCVEIHDPDIWWHLRTGQLIWQRGHVPQTDWFTYTNPGSPWIDLHWGFQLLVAGLWQLGGAPALVVAKALLGAAAFGLLLLAGKPAWPAWQAVACYIPSLLIYSGRNQVRPEMLSYVLLAASLLILFHARRRPALVWWLPLIQLVWVNVHALFVLGLLAWGAFVGHALLRRLWSSGLPPDERQVPWHPLLLVSLCLAAVTLANPYGIQGALFPLVLLGRIQGAQRDFYRQFAAEFDGMGEFIEAHGVLAVLANLSTLMLVVLFLLTLASFAWLLRRRRADPYRLVVFVAFAWLAWQASRNSVLFALAGGMVLRTNAGELFETVRASAAAARRGRMALALLLGVLIVAVPAGVLGLVSPSVQRFGLGEARYAFAHDAARFLGRPGMPGYVYAVDQGAAAVYIFHNGPKRRVFADGRLEVNTRRTLERYLLVARQLASRDPELIENLTRGIPPGPDGRREIPALLMDLREPLWVAGPLGDSRFRPVYYDEAAIVFLPVERAERLHLPAADVAGLARAVLLRSRPPN